MKSWSLLALGYTEPILTCIRLLFRTDTNDLAGGVRRGKGAMVTSHTGFVLKEGPAGWGGLPTAAAELPTPPRPLELQGPTARCCVKQHAGGCGPAALWLD